MLPKELRIKVIDFRKNPHPVRKITSGHFSLYIKKNGERLKFVIRVPGYLDKRAVRRNQTRRIVENLILSLRNNLKGKKMVLVVAKKIISKKETAEVGRELKELFINEFS